MTIQNRTVAQITASGALRRLGACQSIPIALSYRLACLMRLFAEAEKLFHDTRQKIIEKYGDRDESGNLIVINNNYHFSENVEQVQSDINELMELDSDIDIEPLEIELSDMPEGILSAVDIIALEPIIKMTSD